MTDVSRLRTLRHALHADAYTFTGTPGTLSVLRPTDDAASFLPRNRTPEARNLRSMSGRKYPHIRGRQNTDELTLALEFRGVNSNTDAAVSDWEAKMEQGYLLASLFGAVAPATSGTATTVAASGHDAATGVLGVASEANYAAGQVVAFASSDGLQVGRVASTSTGELTLEHPYSGTPTTGATVYRSAVWTLDDDVTHHTHTFFSAEGENWRRDYFGCMPMSMAIETGGAALAFTSVWGPSSWADVAEADPAHAEPTSGSPIVMDAANLWFAGAQWVARNFSLAMSCGTKVRPADTKVNGRLGGVCSASDDGKMMTLEFDIYLGDGNLTGELQDSTGTPDLNALLGDDDAAGDVSTTRQVALQVGTEIGAGMYVYMGEADTVVTTRDVDGLTMAHVVCTGTGAVPGVLAVY